MREHGLILLYVHGNHKLGLLGQKAQDGHLNSHTAPEIFITQLCAWTDIGPWLCAGKMPGQNLAFVHCKMQQL